MLAEQFNAKCSARYFPRHFRFLASFVIGILLTSPAGLAADRTTFLLPLASDAAPGELPDDAVFPEQAIGEVASDGWRNYMRLWKAHHRSPSDKSIRQYLGLPLKGAVQPIVRRGRSAPRWMGWRPGTFDQIETPHFTIYTHAEKDSATSVATDLERCYWIWTQMFFPHWEGSAQVTTTLEGLGDQDVASYLASKPSRITVRRKLRVVLFRDANEYQSTLAPDNPGIEQSTGFYNDDRQTIFLYASDAEDKPTRRHELVHQLFREATRSTLGRQKPGEQSDFWIVEGVAGYFESLRLFDRHATVGGWDSRRLQFARYRVLASGDVMPINELRADGRLSAQKRDDLARWYAHSIAQSHYLLDGGNAKERVGYYQLLNRTYKIKNKLTGGAIAPNAERRLVDFLRLNAEELVANSVTYPLFDLCLSTCELDDKALGSIPKSDRLRWLDLSRMPIHDDAIKRLMPEPKSLSQLSLEATKITNQLSPWLSQATQLTELDLSFTPVDDEIVMAIRGHNQLEVLWLTGTLVGDDSIDLISKIPALDSVDLQRTKVSAAGIAKLKSLCPKLNINPIQLR